jgi:hypothetical protein
MGRLLALLLLAPSVTPWPGPQKRVESGSPNVSVRNDGGSYAIAVDAGFQPRTLDTCVIALEGVVETDILSGGLPPPDGGSGTGKRTKRCLCSSNGSDGGFQWQNLATGTIGTSSACGTE